MKNIIKTGLVAVISFTPLISIAQAAFPDVPADYIYSDAINYVQSEGIVGGFSDGTYRPEDSITRAEFIKILINSNYEINNEFLSDIECTEIEAWASGAGGSYYGGFDDVEDYYPETYSGSDLLPEEGNKFAKYICTAKMENIISGYSDGTFRPDNPITFGEASKIISNAYGFTDVQSGPEGDVFKPFIDALVEKKAIPETIIDLDDDLMRGEMAEFIFLLETSSNSEVGMVYEDLKWIEFEEKSYYGKYDKEGNSILGEYVSISKSTIKHPESWDIDRYPEESCGPGLRSGKKYIVPSNNM